MEEPHPPETSHESWEAPCERRLFLKRFAMGVGGLLAGGAALEALLGGARAAAALEVPFEPGEEGLVLKGAVDGLTASRDYTLAESAYVAYPTLELDPSRGRLWTAWAEEKEDRSRILLRPFDTKKETWGETLETAGVVVSFEGACAYQPALARGGDRMAVVWTETARGSWALRARALDLTRDAWEADAQTLAQGTRAAGRIAWRPALVALPGGRFALAWEEKSGAGAPFTIRWTILDARLRPTFEPLGAAAPAGPEADQCRPALAVSPTGDTLALAYDQYEGGGTTQIYLALLSPATLKVTEPAPVALTRHPATDLAPDVAFSPDGDLVWVAWHTNRAGDDGWDLPRWFRLRAVECAGMRPFDPAWPPPLMDLEKKGTDQGFEFTRLVVAPNGAVCVLGRASHRFLLQYYHGDQWSGLYRFPIEGWGGRGQLAHGAFDAEGRLWVIRRDYGGCFLECVSGVAALPAAKPHLSPCAELAAAPAAAPAVLSGVDPHYEFPPVERKKSAAAAGEATPPAAAAPETAYQVFFGDIHGHSWMSDGMGDVDEGFRRARDVFHDDFYALTDHDSFVRQKLLTAEYEEQKALVDRFYEPGRFVPIYAQEWTTARVGAAPHGYGHKNLYSLAPDHPLFDHTDPRWRDAPALFAELRRLGMIAIPHHIGWTGVDWENHDPEIQPLVEICSGHGVFEFFGNEPIPHRGGLPGNFVQDGLARGLRFGLVGGSDQHGLIWHHGICWKRNSYRAGLTGVYAPALTREAIFEAFRARRTFATTGVKLRPELQVEGLLPGEEGALEKPPLVQVDVLALERIRWITVVRNGEDIRRYGGEARHSRFSFRDTSLAPGQTAWYYLRVQLESGNMAWTSPVWVTLTA